MIGEHVQKLQCKIEKVYLVTHGLTENLLLMNMYTWYSMMKLMWDCFFIVWMICPVFRFENIESCCICGLRIKIIPSMCYSNE